MIKSYKTHYIIDVKYICHDNIRSIINFYLICIVKWSDKLETSFIGPSI